MRDVSLCSTAEFAARRTGDHLDKLGEQKYPSDSLSLPVDAFCKSMMCLLSRDPELASVLNNRVQVCRDHALLRFLLTELIRFLQKNSIEIRACSKSKDVSSGFF